MMVSRRMIHINFNSPYTHRIRFSKFRSWDFDQLEESVKRNSRT